MDYNTAEPIVEDLVRIKSRKFAKGFLSQEDIAQEIRIKCFTSLDNFDPQRGQSLKTFLNICTENHLRNLIRDKFAKFDPPCRNKGCSHYDVNGRPTKDANNCSAFVKYMEKYSRKCNVRMPRIMDESWADTDRRLEVSCEVGASDLNMSIREMLVTEFPDNFEIMIEAYENMIAGKNVLKGLKFKIQRAVSKLLEEDKNNYGRIE